MFCQIRAMIHALAMRTILWLPVSSAVILTLSNCANNGGSSTATNPTGTGPFDSQGNYHEEWANDPSKWRKPGSHSQPTTPSDDVPVIAKNEQPPLNASPFAAAEPSHASSPTKTSSTRRKTSQSAAEPKTLPSKHKPTAPSSSHTDKTSSPTEKTSSHSEKTSSHANKTSTHSDDDAPKPKVTSKSATKTTPKTTSKTTGKSGRYTVKKGDSLDSIAEHSNATAAEIRKANHLTGSQVQPGKTLVIPNN